MWAKDKSRLVFDYLFDHATKVVSKHIIKGIGVLWPLKRIIGMHAQLVLK